VVVAHVVDSSSSLLGGGLRPGACFLVVPGDFDRREFPVAQVVEALLNLLVGVHHDRSAPGDRLIDALPGEQDSRAGGVALDGERAGLAGGGVEADDLLRADSGAVYRGGPLVDVNERVVVLDSRRHLGFVGQGV
jgi:hypothetical protein